MNKTEFPFLIGFPITNICNLNCPHCLRAYGKLHTNSWNMSPAVAEDLARKIAGKAQLVNLSAGYGEPYLNPNVTDILNSFHSYGLKTMTYTNGSYSSHPNILSSYTDYLIISMDSFHRIGNKSILAHQLDLLELISKKKEQIAKKIIITVVINGMVYSPEYIYIVKQLCDTYDFVSAEFHWKMNYETNSRDSDNNSDEILNEYKALFNSISKSKITPPRFEKATHNMCYDLFRSLYFDQHGNVRSCCISMDSMPELNIFRQDLDVIWNSQILEHLRNDWLDGRDFYNCKNCPIGYGFIWKKD